jgi:hypothetical protein
MVGEAVDRHLFALCVASRGLNMEHEFLNKYRNAKWENVSGWELSTRYAVLVVFVETCLVARQLVSENFTIRKSTTISQRSSPVSVGQTASESGKIFLYQK